MNYECIVCIIHSNIDKQMVKGNSRWTHAVVFILLIKIRSKESTF